MATQSQSRDGVPVTRGILDRRRIQSARASSQHEDFAIELHGTTAVDWGLHVRDFDERVRSCVEDVVAGQSTGVVSGPATDHVHNRLALVPTGQSHDLNFSSIHLGVQHFRGSRRDVNLHDLGGVLTSGIPLAAGLL